MIYIVSGDGARTGSTMMMQALIKGGIPGAWVRNDDYELGLKEQYSVGYPAHDKYDGMVVKALPPPWGAGLKLVARPPDDGYKVVWVHRGPLQRWKSFLKLHKRAYNVKSMSDVHMELRTAIDETAMNGPKRERVELMADYCDGRAVECLEIMRQRRDMDVLEIDYDLICREPLKVFVHLQDHGWPIQPLLAAQVPKVLTRK